jgi:hypothetical protein
MPEGEFYASFRADPHANGWHSLARIAWVGWQISSITVLDLDLVVDYGRIDNDEPRAEELIFTLKGRGVDPSEIADVLQGSAR